MKNLKLLLIAALLAIPAAAFGQVRPGAFSTLVTTDTTANSLLVGCAIGSTACTGGIKTGVLAVASTATFGGITAFNDITTFNSNTNFTSVVSMAATGVALTCDGVTADQNVSVTTFTTVRFTTAGSGTCAVGGLTGGTDGRVLFLMNATGHDVSIVFEDGSSTAANRISTPGSGALTLGTNTFTFLIYDTSVSRWRTFKGVA